MKTGKLTAGGKCLKCGQQIAWLQTTKGYSLRDPQKDEAGNIVYKMTMWTDKAGKPRTANRPVPSETKHQCSVPPESLVVEQPVYKVCNSRDRDYICTLLVGHTGDHEAHTDSTMPPVHTWPQVPDVAPDAPEPTFTVELKPSNVPIEQPITAPSVDEDRVRLISRQELKRMLDELDVRPPARQIVVTVGDREPCPLDANTHPVVAEILPYIARRQHVYLHGPAGSGKP